MDREGQTEGSVRRRTVTAERIAAERVEAAVTVDKVAWLTMGQKAVEEVRTGAVRQGVGGMQLGMEGRVREGGSVEVMAVGLGVVAVGLGAPGKREEGEVDRLMWGRAAAMGVELR